MDFWITEANWAIELLRDGSDMREHEKRFEAGGKYADMPYENFAVVDLRSPPSRSPHVRLRASSYIVIFAAGFSSATVMNGNRSWELHLPDVMEL